MKQEHIVLMKKMDGFTSDPFMGRAFADINTFSMPQSSGFHVDVLVEAIEKKEIAELRRDPGVAGFAPVMPMKLVEPVNPEGKEAVAEQINWGLDATKVTTSPYSGKGIKVAILDTGIDENHEAFKGVNLTLRNFTTEPDADQNGHGTHVAGTVFGRKVNGRRIGVATGIEEAIIGKVLGNGGGSTSQIYQAILWASKEGASIISMSLGIDFPGYVKSLADSGYPVDLATSRALEAYRANILLYGQLSRLLKLQGSFMPPSIMVAAAGNESKRDINPAYEIAIAPPASSDGVLSVGALGIQDDNHLFVAPFSNTGPDISAPGVDVVSAKLGGGLISYNGTSMATPHVAGVMALWAEKLISQGRFDIGELVARVVGSASIAPLEPQIDLYDVGAGIIQAPQ